MRSIKIVGDIPKHLKGRKSVEITRATKWRFVDDCDCSHDIDDSDEVIYTAQVPDDQFDQIQQDILADFDESSEDTISFEMPMVQTNGAARSTPANGGFGTRRHALQKLGIDVDPDAGDDIGIVILDAGINRDYIESIAGPGRYGGGWTNQSAASSVGRYVDPNERAADVHGNMIVRNILSIAPKAIVYDAPILPPRVYSLPDFSVDVVGALNGIRRVIKNSAGNPSFPTHKHWILVNAWAVATSFAAAGQRFSYVNDRRNRVNKRIIRLAKMDNVDVVFAAGNSGTFQPAPFSGPYDRGHGRSIWGANGLEEVFTIGAVRTDGISIGTSSQGPSLAGLMKSGSGKKKHNKKPELCAPSWFSEDNDPSILNSGTSAACALFTGQLARARATQINTPSANIKTAMIGAASDDGEWRAQRGYGILT